VAPLFSIVVPSRDRPRQLASCLKALAALDYPADGFEVIVVDDGSSPPVSDVVTGGPEHLRILRQESDGPASARNAGAAIATGRYLAFIDDDCMVDPGWLRALEDRLADDRDLCLGGATVNGLPDNLFSSASQLLIDYLYQYYDEPRGRFFCSNNLCVPAEKFWKVGGFDTGFLFPAGEDRDFCSRWQEAGGKMAYAPAARVGHAHALTLLGFYRQHFRYGRGAYYFHSRRSARTGLRLKVEPIGFYWRLMLFPFQSLRPMRALATCGLLIVSQVANVAGFFWEWGRPR
jgi:GT2 family glycosyltransferase